MAFLRDEEFNWLSDRAVGTDLNIAVTGKHGFRRLKLICPNSSYQSVYRCVFLRN